MNNLKQQLKNNHLLKFKMIQLLQIKKYDFCISVDYKVYIVFKLDFLFNI